MIRRTFPLLVAGLLAAGCGATVEPAAEGESTQVTITNCGVEASYPSPSAPVSYDYGATDKMFALGLADRMRGYVMNSLADPSIASSPWRADYDTVPRLGTERITKEIVIDARADWVTASWGGGFGEERGITPKLLDQVGINSYVQTETCWDYGDRKPVTPLEALYVDLENLGRIFGVEDKATEVVSDLRDRVDALEETHPAGEPARVFVYDSGTDQPYTSGKYASPNDIIASAGGRNVLDELDQGWTTVGWESVTAADPEVIVIVEYADQPVADKQAFLESLPALAATTAVQQDRYFVLPYGDAVNGPRNVAAAEKLGTYLRSIGR
jgi:iron complex transport system substrate-binding protein